LNHKQNEYVKGETLRGFEPEKRYEIIDHKGERTKMLEENISV